jgi:hypothetical protein
VSAVGDVAGARGLAPAAMMFPVEDVVPFGSPSGEPARLTGIFHPAGSELTSRSA